MIYQHLKNVEELFVPPLNTYVNLEDYSRKLSTKAYTIEILFDNNLVGLVAYYNNDQYLYLSNISIDKEYLKNGYGTILINKLIEKSLLYKKKILLEVNKENIKAVRFYKKHGFIVNKTIHDTYEMCLKYIN
jgi:ribosomal protein S18 acetylase RimI-like enzyme